jgi:DNA invertase Pin-like site-specific DNA recombinase
VDAGRPALKACLEYLREGDTLLVTKLDRLARSTRDLYRIISNLAERGVSFKVVDAGDHASYKTQQGKHLPRSCMN